MVEAVKGTIKQYLQGLKDSLYGFTHILQLNKKMAEQNRKKRQRMQEDIQSRRYRNKFETRRPLHSNQTSTSRQTSPSKTEYGLMHRLALNTSMSILIWISIWGFYGFVVPFLKSLIESIIRFMSSSSVSEEEVNAANFWEKTELLLQLLFNALWVLPLCLISKIVNTFYFVDVSNAIYHHFRGQPRAFSSTGRMIADFTFSIIVQMFFLMQAKAVEAIPILVEVTSILCYIHHCLLYALAASEYKWFNMGLDFRLRIELIETHWPYFCGFGTPLFVLTQLSYMYYSFFVSAFVYSFLFPFFIIAATKAETPSEIPAVRFRIFDVCLKVCDTAFKLTIRN